MTEEMTQEPFSMNVMQIMEMLPHRYPFLLVDRITECVPGKYCKGYKNLTMNEEFFQGHFPNNPVMPGVLQLEALAQLSAGILFPVDKYKDKLFFYAGIDNVRFRKQIRPGDRFDMESELVKLRDPIAKAHAKGFVDGQLAVEDDLMFSIVGTK
jgi:3-hydroxyacyl-[acyl-carrier-protein] dehydratase